MKKFSFFLICLFCTLILSAQIRDPVKWTYTAKKISESTYEIHLTAKIDEGWHVYSQHTPEGGPVKTTVEFLKNPLVTFKGYIKEVGKMYERFEQIFGVQVKEFSNKLDLVQKVVLKGKVKTTVNGTVEFMVCNDHECLPPTTKSFSIPLK